MLLTREVNKIVHHNSMMQADDWCTCILISIGTCLYKKPHCEDDFTSLINHARMVY